MSTERFPEAFVAWLWRQRQVGGPLVTQDGRRVQVIYPGRPVGSWGPDFRGALLAFDGALVHGDVEVHVRARDWHVHGHGSDVAYGNTVLHVVMAAEPALPAVRADGHIIPTLALEPALEGETATRLLATFQAGLSPAQPDSCRTPDEAAVLIARAGMARFATKSARFEGDFAVVDPAQALWAGLFEALGYSANVVPFRRLANRVPLLEARSAAEEGPQALLALLLGEAGLLPHQRGRFAFDEQAQDLERWWWAADRYGPTSPLGWRAVGVRPGNAPVRRVVAAATLLSTDREAPLHQRVLGALAELPPERAPAALRTLVLCPGDAYWHAHADFGRPLRRACNLVGPQRAADIVVNVLLPWAAALGSATDQEPLRSAAEAVYQLHPPLASNEITRHMAHQILGPGGTSVVRNACYQQGLIHIYRGWCDERDCGGCPAGPPRWMANGDGPIPKP
jgi:Protein of unknown function (DUF2851)